MEKETSAPYGTTSTSEFPRSQTIERPAEPAPFSGKQSGADQDPILFWTFVAMAMAWAILAYSTQSIQGVDGAAALGYVIGQGLFIALLLWIVGRTVSKRRPWVGRTIVGAIFFAFAIQAHLKERRVIDDARSALKALAAPPSRVDRGTDTLSMAYVTSKYMSEVESAWERYQDSTSSMGDDFLAPRMLSTASGRRGSPRDHGPGSERDPRRLWGASPRELNDVAAFQST